MQPKTLAFVVAALPILVINIAYLMSASANLVPQCIPYFEGCTSISRAARVGNALFVFRATMIVQAVLLICYWKIALHWLEQLANKRLTSARLMFWIGTIGALFLILYADFLGTHGSIYRYLRRYGIIFFFTFTPLAQMIMLNLLFKINQQLRLSATFTKVLRYQLVVVVSILALGFISLSFSYSGTNSFERENIIEWIYAVLMSSFHFGSYFIWAGLKLKLTNIHQL